ncbi:hypothetical protein [Deinococcus soli (ex Cha et al. 2016)]|uniref:hypothetical protein n=1 Tax=Deinococcus soli (ex Cha et al. 2016) TaxID=1309411 RepID=UPI0016671B82|nr:hypothetical protein [Deinococcus soli (ex Cha et al. 2016)]
MLNDEGVAELEGEFAGFGAAVEVRVDGVYYRDHTGLFGPFRSAVQAFVHLLGDGAGES